MGIMRFKQCILIPKHELIQNIPGLKIKKTEDSAFIEVNITRKLNIPAKEILPCFTLQHENWICVVKGSYVWENLKTMGIVEKHEPSQSSDNRYLNLDDIIGPKT